MFVFIHRMPSWGTGYQIYDQYGMYYLTFTIVDWVDYAGNAWKATTGESLNSNNVFGWTVPAILAGSIVNKNGGKYSNKELINYPGDPSVRSSAESLVSNSSCSSGSNGSGSGSSTSSSSSGCVGADASESSGSGSICFPIVGGGGSNK